MPEAARGDRGTRVARGRAAPSAPEETVTVLVAPGDTLISIARARLEAPRGWQDLARYNDIRSPRRLQPGERLSIPVTWAAAGAGRRAGGTGDRRGARRRRPAHHLGPATARAERGADRPRRGSWCCGLGDGSTLRIAPASRLRIERLRSYHRQDVIDARVALERGRVETLAASPRRRPLQIRSPYATAAVRGTSFRVATADAGATTEVLVGAVGWGREATDGALA